MWDPIYGDFMMCRSYEKFPTSFHDLAVAPDEVNHDDLIEPHSPSSYRSHSKHPQMRGIILLIPCWYR